MDSDANNNLVKQKNTIDKIITEKQMRKWERETLNQIILFFKLKDLPNTATKISYSFPIDL